jgi:hypothetical protein
MSTTTTTDLSAMPTPAPAEKQASPAAEPVQPAAPSVRLEFVRRLVLGGVAEITLKFTAPDTALADGFVAGFDAELAQQLEQTTEYKQLASLQDKASQLTATLDKLKAQSTAAVANRAALPYAADPAELPAALAKAQDEVDALAKQIAAVEPALAAVQAEIAKQPATVDRVLLGIAGKALLDFTGHAQAARDAALVAAAGKIEQDIAAAAAWAAAWSLAAAGTAMRVGRRLGYGTSINYDGTINATTVAPVLQPIDEQQALRRKFFGNTPPAPPPRHALPGVFTTADGPPK